MRGRWTAVAALAVLAACVWPATARPEDAAFVVTSTPSSATPTPGLPPLPSGPVPVPAAAPAASAAAPADAQVARAPAPQVRSLHVNSEVQYRYAHTVVSSRVANPANQSQEVEFSVVLPETAFISSFAMEVDGKVYKAYVKEKKEAKQTYDAAVAAGQSAAHVAVNARDSNSFTVSLNVEPQHKVSFNLTYEELLTRKLGLYNHVVTLNPGQVVRDLQVRVHIKENKNITKLRVPEFTSGNKIDGDIQDCNEGPQDKPGKCGPASGNSIATITYASPSEVEVVFRPSEEEQRDIMAKLEAKKKEEAAAAPIGYRHPFGLGGDLFEPSEDNAGDKSKEDGLNGQFSVEYDVDRPADGGEVVVNDGYFVHFFSPSELKPLKKHAIFVLDVSGSMGGRKIEQLRGAMLAILEDLKDGDYFNLIEFSSAVKVWNLDDPSKSMVTKDSDGWGGWSGGPTTTAATPVAERPPAYRATKDNIEKAKNIVNQMGAFGGTNIFDALKIALDCARDGAQSAAMSDSAQQLEPIILFLTDGDPTVGVTAPTKITAGISELNNKPRAAVFSLAFGDGADIKFLRKISVTNAGFARTIYEAADASLQLKNFYRQISSPLLANVTFQYIPEKVERDSMTQLDFRTYFDGTELVVAGRTADKGVQEVSLGVKAVADGGTQATYKPHTVPVDYTIAAWPYDPEGPVSNHTRAPRQVTVLERLWAYLTIKQLLDQQDAQDATKVDEDVIKPVWVGGGQGGGPVALPAVNVAAPPGDANTASTTGAPAASTTDADVADLDLSVFKAEPKKRALELALKYSFVTPLTSLVVVKPNETKTTDAQVVNPADSANAAALQGGTGNRFGSGSYALAFQRPAAASAFAGGQLLTTAFYAPPPPPPPPTTPGGPPRPPGAALDTLVTDEKDPVSHTLATRPPPTSTTSVSEPLHTAANISDVKWLPKDALLRGSVVLHLNGTDQTYKISNNETDPVPPQVCQLSGVVPSQGVCRHFSHCVLGQVVQRIEDFVKYQCTIGDYLAICCPSDVAPTSQPASQPPV